MSVASAVLDWRNWRPALTAAVVLGVASAWSMPASAAGEAGLQPGEFAMVRIMGSDEHDLYGEVEYEG